MSVYPRSYRVNSTGEIELGGVPVSVLAREYGTPLYVMDEETLRYQCRQYEETLKRVYPRHLTVFAGKAGMTIGLLNLIAEEGLGVDVVSAGELYTALKSRISSDRMVFHGNNKSIPELEMAVEAGVRIVLDNGQEIRNLAAVCKRLGKTVRVLVRLKPEIEAHTHDYIKTGQIDSKFGFDKEALVPVVREVLSVSQLVFEGLHAHIGSQVFDVQPFEDLADIMVRHIARLKQELDVSVRELNLGGGIGIQYTESDDPPAIPLYLERMTQRLLAACERENVEPPFLLVEPGRSIVALAGVTLYTVGAVKSIPGVRDYVFVDGGMADNIRPLLYQSQYTFRLANKAQAQDVRPYAIAGKYCESGDILAKDIPLPEAAPGDILAVFGTGAYNYAMSSNYNRSPRPAMVWVGHGRSSLLLRRETYEDLVRCDAVQSPVEC